MASPVQSLIHRLPLTYLSESPVRIVSRQHRMTFVMIVDVVHVRNRVEVAYNMGCTEGLTCLH